MVEPKSKPKKSTKPADKGKAAPAQNPEIAKDIHILKDFAVLALGGKQQIVRPNERLRVELLPEPIGSTIELKEVLLRKVNDQVEVGQPYITSASVKAIVVGETKGDKIKVFHKKRRKHHRKTTGHRQHYSVIEIQAV